MKMTMNMGAFEELDQQEMIVVDGGCLTFCAWIAIGLFVVGTGVGIGWALCD